MIVIFILMIVIGVFTIVKPELTWRRNWWSQDDEPSYLGLLGQRIAGTILVLIGIIGSVSNLINLLTITSKAV
ncbi:MAG: hypothetical protein FWC89_04565 [Defluviitaleaceae bacterium]|nr:hypothetical protein [Defluviitaleaceae bacterium]